ncbi:MULTISPECIES: metallophosphoesterase family protein [Arcobacteraceae]|uniref:Metallophosphatase family protein n=1 Tax=Poseidonibacter parvus TaxID=1850254 RepID=A0A1P8KML1_9BACT|nr:MULTISPECIES: metallophosphoesterase family protein [Arcobacteraceae]APW65786.1 metallophosphatase family protein [Poseidonibacter parvus]
MKIAILSDIKSNVYALEAVLDDTKKNHVDVLLNLGDSFFGPIAPKETYDLIRKNDFITLLGDEDRQILEASLAQLEINETLKFVYNDLNDEVLYWIQELPFEKLIGDDFYMVHGTYQDDSLYMLEDASSGRLELHNDKKILEILDDIKSKFIFCGNSCTPRCVNLSSGQVVINPGSVGLQACTKNIPNNHTIENNTPEASYVILTIEDDKYDIQLRKIPYDTEKAALKASQNGRDDWAYRLRTGKLN